MFHSVDTAKSWDRACADTEAAIMHRGFGVLYVHNLGSTLRGKGVAFVEECRVYEICNPAQAAKVLSADMRLNMALPCRISVWTERGRTKIGFIKPGQMLAALSTGPALGEVAREVEGAMTGMLDEAK